MDHVVLTLLRLRLSGVALKEVHYLISEPVLDKRLLLRNLWSLAMLLKSCFTRGRGKRLVDRRIASALSPSVSILLRGLWPSAMLLTTLWIMRRTADLHVHDVRVPEGDAVPLPLLSL